MTVGGVENEPGPEASASPAPVEVSAPADAVPAAPETPAEPPPPTEAAPRTPLRTRLRQRLRLRREVPDWLPFAGGEVLAFAGTLIGAGLVVFFALELAAPAPDAWPRFFAWLGGMLTGD